LATGARINKAADDAAGLAISTSLEHRIVGQRAAKQNALEGISLIQTAEGGVEQVRGMLDRMRELSVRAANETLSDSDRGNADLEFQQLKAETDRIASTTNYNGVSLLAATVTLTFQVGFNDAANNRIVATLVGNFVSSGANSHLSLTGDIGSISAAGSMLAKIDGALSRLNAFRSKLGSVQNRLERSISNLESDIENATAANSRIRDVDFAEETSKMTRLQILVQSGVAVLSQANASPQAALSLLG
jgi:flagellin